MRISGCWELAHSSTQSWAAEGTVICCWTQAGPSRKKMHFSRMQEQCMWFVPKVWNEYCSWRAGKLPGLHIQQNSQAVSRVTCMCWNIFFVSSPIYVYGEGEEYELPVGPQPEPTKGNGNCWFYHCFWRETHYTSVHFDVYNFFLFGAKETFVWSELYSHSQNLQKLIVNVFANGIS